MDYFLLEFNEWPFLQQWSATVKLLDGDSVLELTEEC